MLKGFIDWLIKDRRKPYLVYGLLALAVMAPMLGPGYVFAMDMVFGPEIDLPAASTASYPFYLLLKAVSFVLPVAVIQKLLLFTIIVLCGVGAHRLAQNAQAESRKPKAKSQSAARQFPPFAYYAGILYAVNPFTYARFMDGHYGVLLGYAMLPFFARALFEFLFLGRPGLKGAVKLAAVTWLTLVLSIHAVGYLIIVGMAAAGAALILHRKNTAVLTGILKFGGLGVVLVTVASLYWLIPDMSGSSARAELIQEFDKRHMLSFRTAGGSDAAVAGNVLSLYGYWGEREGRFASPKATNPLWQLMTAAIVALAAYGLYRSRHLPEARALAAAGTAAAILAIGIAAEPFSYLNEWLAGNIPFFRGYREPQKFAAVLALAYAVLGAVGLESLKLKVKSLKPKPSDKKDIPTHNYYLLTAALLLPLLYTPTFLWGFAGQLQSRQYPADWGQIDHAYLEKAAGATLFLPWHQYMYFDFAGRIIANPAPRFFTGRVIAGDNPEIGLIKRQTNSAEAAIIEPLLERGGSPDFGKKLLPLDVEYILLAKTADWKDYAFLDNQPDLHLIDETPTLKLYRNKAFDNGGL